MSTREPTCVECGREFGLSEYYLPVLQTRITGRGKRQGAYVEYVHLWHLTNPEA